MWKREKDHVKKFYIVSSLDFLKLYELPAYLYCRITPTRSIKTSDRIFQTIDFLLGGLGNASAGLLARVPVYNPSHRIL